MSVIVHRCTVCGHADVMTIDQGVVDSPIANGRVGCGQPGCCGHRQHAYSPTSCKWGEPQIMRTFNPDMTENFQVIEPGRSAFGVPQTNSCSCDDCMALYGRVTS
jgi:hypothetical protein